MSVACACDLVIAAESARFNAGYTRIGLTPDGSLMYVLARSGDVSRSFCASLGGDIARAEGRWAAAEGRTMQLGRVAGCHTVRHIIVCSDEDGACLAHEERHRAEGPFHP